MGRGDLRFRRTGRWEVLTAARAGNGVASNNKKALGEYIVLVQVAGSLSSRSITMHAIGSVPVFIHFLFQSYLFLSMSSGGREHGRDMVGYRHAKDTVWGKGRKRCLGLGFSSMEPHQFSYWKKPQKMDTPTRGTRL